MPLIAKLTELLGKLPIEAVTMLVELVEGALASDDPARFIERRTAADASHAAAQKAVHEALDRFADETKP